MGRPADRPGGGLGGRTQPPGLSLRLCPSLQVGSCVLQIPVMTVSFSRPGSRVGPRFSAQLTHAPPRVWAGLRRLPVLSPKLLPGARGRVCGGPCGWQQCIPSACLSRLPAVRALGRQAGHHRPLQHRCSPSPSPNSSQLLQRIWGHPEHFLGTEMRNGPMWPTRENVSTLKLKRKELTC